MDLDSSYGVTFKYNIGWILPPSTGNSTDRACQSTIQALYGLLVMNGAVS